MARKTIIPVVEKVAAEVFMPLTVGGGIRTVEDIRAILLAGADKVTIHTTSLGGGLGRKAEQDFVSQAVQVGMALGKPVKLMWPREEDFSNISTAPPPGGGSSGW